MRVSLIPIHINSIWVLCGYVLSGWSYLTHGLTYVLLDYVFPAMYDLYWVRLNHEWFLFQLIDITRPIIIEWYKALYSHCLDSMYSQPCMLREFHLDHEWFLLQLTNITLIHESNNLWFFPLHMDLI